VRNSDKTASGNIVLRHSRNATVKGRAAAPGQASPEDNSPRDALQEQNTNLGARSIDLRETRM
jgi:hypothetical protein